MVIANGEQEQEIRLKNMNKEVAFIFENAIPAAEKLDDIDVLFILNQDIHAIDFKNFRLKPIFINSVIDTLLQLQLPDNVSRINAWPGFLQRETWELVSENKMEAQAVFEVLQWKIIFVKDEPGMVAARVVSMIINEAFFALEERISTKEEIDLAMKLGTHYPWGPFEWAEKIGLKNVANLLKKLYEKDARYFPASTLQRDL